ncbi:MAG: CoA-binding protein [Chitinophagales bacterium]|nr:CoA-binding protein [Chitinophagales bacterium]
MESKKTLVLGATEDPSRYANLAINRLLSYGHEVVAIGKEKGAVKNVAIETEKLPFDAVDTVTLYLRPSNQKEYLDYIIGLNPKRIIFNPGTENDELIDLAYKNGIEPIEGCTLVMLSTGQY